MIRIDFNWNLISDSFRLLPRINSDWVGSIFTVFHQTSYKQFFGLARIQISEWMGIVLIGSEWIPIRYFRQGYIIFLTISHKIRIVIYWKISYPTAKLCLFLWKSKSNILMCQQCSLELTLNKLFFLLAGQKVYFSPPSGKKSYARREKHLFYSCEYNNNKIIVDEFQLIFEICFHS